MLDVQFIVYYQRLLVGDWLHVHLFQPSVQSLKAFFVDTTSFEFVLFLLRPYNRLQQQVLIVESA